MVTFRAAKPARYWFAWRPVWLKDGSLAWLEVLEVDRGYACGEGPWKTYSLANEPRVVITKVREAA